MWKRVKQFVRACFSHISSADRVFISEYLNSREQELFYGMSVPDQFHCRRVAADILRLAAGCNETDNRLLVRCALLHDVGRRQGDVGTLDKVFAVLLETISSPHARRWARQGRGNRLQNLRHALYVYYHHPQRSVALLHEVDATEELIRIVSAHHQEPVIGESVALQLLRQADDLN
jgi:putative nucleotidyltransferase with HDIG domain